ncbi:MAG: HAMP domain-containing histidine kinase [Myxococcales bacterium]|nr:HAMP domain-containing histidine kinase [Myxococcales bacterium]
MLTPPTPEDERGETDTSLDAERQKADELLTERAASLADAAASVLALASQEADVLIETARDHTDAALDHADQPTAVRAEIAAARDAEDAQTEARRTAAAATLADEQRAHQRAIKHLLAIERDETDQRLQKERERADHRIASRDDFFAMVSHDVRSLLGSISLSADALRGADHDRAGAVREADRILRLTARMNRLVGDLLDVVSLEAGKLKIDPATHDLRDLLAETVESFQALAAAREVQLIAARPAAPMRTRCDSDRMLQVLANLVSNALKFTTPGGHVALAVARAGASFDVTVRDDGRGIAPDQQEAIFDRFSQASQLDRRGLGLGLYIARGVLEAHGGSLSVTSALGAGATFHATLPAA